MTVNVTMQSDQAIKVRFARKCNLFKAIYPVRLKIVLITGIKNHHIYRSEV